MVPVLVLLLPMLLTWSLGRINKQGVFLLRRKAWGQESGSKPWLEGCWVMVPVLVLLLPMLITWSLGRSNK